MVFTFVNGASKSDSLGFTSPVDHQIRLTGNFMEIRTNHFHSGIDIKSSKGVSGDNIMSVQDGYISRIKVQSGSYGQSVYIDHPNGYTSVYAHLDSYIPKIEEYLKSIQYKLERHAVDIYLPDSLLLIKQGEIIGKMGNTGRSFGPHLHFELRKTKTEIPVNPELLGLGPQDDIAPTFQSLVIYELDENNQVKDSKTKYFKKKENRYQLYDDPVMVDNNRVAFGIQGFDQMNGTGNKNGIYSLRVKVNGKDYFKWNARNFSFEESKKINGFIDYKKQVTLGQKVYKLFEPYCSAMTNIQSVSKGIIDLKRDRNYSVEIIATDIHGNYAHLEFKVQGAAGDSQEGSVIDCDTSTLIKSGMFRITFPPKSLFDPLSYSPTSGTELIDNQKCHSIKIGESTEAVSKYYKIETPIPDDYSRSWTFVTRDKKGRLVTFGSDTLNNRMFAYVDQLGTFYTYKDKTAPTYQIVNLEPSMATAWKVIIKDNLIPDGRVPDLFYHATVNGEWICMAYDIKNNVLVFDDFERLPKGDLQFELIIADGCGNVTQLTRQITQS